MLTAVETRERNRIVETIHKQRSGFLFSYVAEDYQFHAVDRLALYPLFYTIHDGMPQVAQILDELLPFLEKRLLHPEGFYGRGGYDKGSAIIMRNI